MIGFVKGPANSASQVPPDFSIGYGTEIEEEVFDVNGLLLALLLAAVVLMTAYAIRRRRKAGKKR